MDERMKIILSPSKIIIKSRNGNYFETICCNTTFGEYSVYVAIFISK